jgi:rod shape determining protein RodA
VRNIGREIDFFLIATVVLLVIYGIIMIYSATQGDPLLGDYFQKQIVWVLLGLAVAVAVALLDYNPFRGYLPFIYLFAIFILVLVLLPGIGTTTLGAQRRIPIGPFNFQPSEFTKILMILVLAAFLETKRGNIENPSDLLIAFASVAFPSLLIFKQPDLGTALVLVAILLGMLLVGGTKLQYYIAILLLGILVFSFAVYFHLLSDYQMDRLVVFIKPDVAPKSAGYNLAQSKIAIGAGQVFGKGLRSGTQTNLKFLPERHTDFIFSVIGEKLGFMGSTFLLFLFFILVARAIVIATTAKNMFGALISIGVASMWLFQIVVNIGMTIGIMPITGIPLPFVSYGGSSMIANMMGVGLLLSVYSRRYR